MLIPFYLTPYCLNTNILIPPVIVTFGLLLLSLLSCFVYAFAERIVTLLRKTIWRQIKSSFFSLVFLMKVSFPLNFAIFYYCIYRRTAFYNAQIMVYFRISVLKQISVFLIVFQYVARKRERVSRGVIVAYINTVTFVPW